MKEKNIFPYYNNYSKEISKRLWLPEINNLTTLNRSKYLSNYLNIQKCKTSNQPYKNFQNLLWKETQEEDNIRGNITIKIPIYPSKEQKIFLKVCFKAHRKYYNLAVNEINRRFEKKKKEFETKTTCILCNKPKLENSWSCKTHQNEEIKWDLNINRINFRNTLLKKNKEIKKDKIPEEQWLLNIPYDTRELAINQAITAYKIAIDLYKRKIIKKFELKPKEDLNRNICWIDDGSIKLVNNEIIICKNLLKEHSRFKCFNKKVKEITNDTRILYDHGMYYALVLVPEDKSKPLNSGRTIALDPGSRTFLTGYSSSGHVVEFGKKQNEKIKFLYTRLDLFNSLGKKGIKRTWKITRKIKNIVNDLHNQTIKFLVNNYSAVVLGNLSTSDILRNEKLRSSTKRNIQTLSHYKFKNDLMRKHSRALVVSESFTTKTCNCGELNNVGSSDTYKCLSCNYEAPRDIHGARNIMIKTLTHILESGVRSTS